MTEAEAKAIEQTDAERYGVCEYCGEPKRNRQQDCCGNIHLCRDILHKRARDAASRLLAVEAELERLPERFCAAVFVQAGLGLQDASAALMVSRRILEESEQALAAPPSPPVAPEPAQEAGGLKVPTTHDMARQWVMELTTNRPSWHRDLTAYINAQEQSEREAAGLRIQLTQRLDGLRELQQLYAAFEGSGHRPKNPREAAQAIGQMADSGREMMALADELNTAREDRDAERTQKEAALLEVSRLSFELGKAQGEAEGHALVRKSAEAEREALRVELKTTQLEACRMHYLGNLIRQRDSAEQAELNALMRKYPPNVVGKTVSDTTSGIASAWKELARANGQAFLDAHRELDDMQRQAAQQPAEASPVAKAGAPEHIHDSLTMADRETCGPCNAKVEAPSEPAMKAPFLSAPVLVRCASDGQLRYLPRDSMLPGDVEQEAPSEPAGYQVFHVCECGHAESAHANGGGFCHLNGCACSKYRQPAPQPPATTGGTDIVAADALFAGLPNWLDDMREAVGALNPDLPCHVEVAKLIDFSRAALSFMNTLHEHLREMRR
jgi:hypothetical protein